MQVNQRSEHHAPTFLCQCERGLLKSDEKDSLGNPEGKLKVRFARFLGRNGFTDPMLPHNRGDKEIKTNIECCSTMTGFDGKTHPLDRYDD